MADFFIGNIPTRVLQANTKNSVSTIINTYIDFTDALVSTIMPLTFTNALMKYGMT